MARHREGATSQSDPDIPRPHPWRAVPQIQGILKDCFHDNCPCFCVAMASLEERKGRGGAGQGPVPRKGMWSLKELLQLGSLLGKDPRAWRLLSLTALEQGGLGLGQTQPDVVTPGVPQNHPSLVSGGSLRASLEKCELRKVLGKRRPCYSLSWRGQDWKEENETAEEQALGRPEENLRASYKSSGNSLESCCKRRSQGSRKGSHTPILYYREVEAEGVGGPSRALWEGLSTGLL